MKWKICYYFTESALRSGAPAFTETITANRNYAEAWAQNKLRNSQFKFYNIVPQQWQGKKNIRTTTRWDN